jgi:hypothetical protein
MEIGSLVIVIGLTLLALFLASFSYGEAHLKHIKENWVKYRCNPLYMPLADAVGSDILSNFMGCTMSAFQTYAGYALDPIYSMFDGVGGILSDIQGTLNDFRDMISGTKSAFTNIVSDIYGKIQNTMSESVRLVARMRTLLQRMVAVLVTIVHMVSTGVDTGQSLANGPIGQAAQFFCFAPSTILRKKGGIRIPIRNIRPGDILEDGSVVNSVLVLDGTKTKMFSLKGICVSGNHKVYHKSKWIRVEEHPDAIALDVKHPHLYCLNTSTNTIQIRDFLFRDYEETSNPKILYKFSSIVEQVHNGEHLEHNKVKRFNPLAYRYTGVHPATPIMMSNGTTKPLHELAIGDTIAKGGSVLGVVYHSGYPDITMIDNVLCSPGTWVFDAYGSKVYVASQQGPSSRDFPVHPIMNVLTEHGYVSFKTNKGIRTMLDDQEVTEDWIHSWRDIQVQKEAMV